MLLGIRNLRGTSRANTSREKNMHHPLSAMWNDAAALVARVLLMSVFLVAGWTKLTNYRATVAYMAGLSVPLPAMATVVAIAIELFVGTLILIGICTRPLALVVMVFTLSAALSGHRYWKMTGIERADMQMHFFKNMSIAGGLLLLALTGPGRYSIDGN